MRILVVQETDWIKRGPHQQHHLMERLSLKGHKIRVIDYRFLWRKEAKKTLYSKRQVLDRVWKVYKKADITLLRPAMLKIPGLEHLSLIFFHKREITRQVKEFKPEVIVGFGILNTYLAMKLAKKNNIPFIYYLIDVLHTLVPTKSVQWVAKAFKRKTLKSSNGVIVINDKLKDYAIEMGANPDRTYLVRAGVDLERFNPHTDRSRVREQYKIKENDFVLFFMGWLYDFSGLKEVALNLAKIKKKEFSLKLLIVGDGDLFAGLERIQRKYNLQDTIILTGWQPYDKIPEFLKASDLCLLPAYDNEVMHNIVPIKMYEYMA
ncbi:glycosyltransferase, partial [Patescibacteria group bacterium]|nr:glycosyltransferase [Patescibacteria group bacterium]